jgi:hypothetical protein
MDIDKIEDILNKYGSIGKTGRVIFKPYAYKLVAKEIGLDWELLTHNQKTFLKGDMILQYSGEGFVKQQY